MVDKHIGRMNRMNRKELAVGLRNIIVFVLDNGLASILVVNFLFLLFLLEG